MNHVASICAAVPCGQADPASSATDRRCRERHGGFGLGGGLMLMSGQGTPPLEALEPLGLSSWVLPGLWLTASVAVPSGTAAYLAWRGPRGRASRDRRERFARRRAARADPVPRCQRAAGGDGVGGRNRCRSRLARSSDLVTSPMPSAAKRRPGSRYDRLSRPDLTMLLTDRGEVPMNTGAVLLFGGGDEGPREGSLRPPRRPGSHGPATSPTSCTGRRRGVAALSGLTARLPGSRTTRRRGLRRSTGLPGLLDLAAALVCERLTLERPPWRACIVTDPATGRVRALVLVVHHVLTDGLGALAVLSALADPGLPTPIGGAPRPRPSYRALALDAARQRVQGVADLPAAAAGCARRAEGAGRRRQGTHLTGQGRRPSRVEPPTVGA